MCCDRYFMFKSVTLTIANISKYYNIYFTKNTYFRTYFTIKRFYNTYYTEVKYFAIILKIILLLNLFIQKYPKLNLGNIK